MVKKEGGSGTQNLELEVRQHDELHPLELLAVVTAGAQTKKQTMTSKFIKFVFEA